MLRRRAACKKCAETTEEASDTFSGDESDPGSLSSDNRAAHAPGGTLQIYLDVRCSVGWSVLQHPADATGTVNVLTVVLVLSILHGAESFLRS